MALFIQTITNTEITVPGIYYFNNGLNFPGGKYILRMMGWITYDVST